MLETLRKLCSLDGVTGNEEPVRKYIQERVAPFADEITSDPMGNLIVFKKGKKTPARRVMLAAHMDEVGVIVTDITDGGYLRFACAGGIDRRILPGKEVFVGPQRVYGVIGSKPIHLLKDDERKRVPKVDDMYIDIGAKDKETAEKLVSLGDTGAFDPETVLFGDGFLKAKAIDDRVGCAAMIKLIESDLPFDCWFVFTVQEEVGCRGVLGAAFRLEPEIAVILEGTTAADLPSVKGAKRICSPGKGVVIPFMDRGSIYDRGLYKFATETADKYGIKWQTKSYIAGGTDASAVQRSRAGVKVIGLAAAMRNIHSPACVAAVSDIEDLPRLAGLLLEELGGTL